MWVAIVLSVAAILLALVFVLIWKIDAQDLSDFLLILKFRFIGLKGAVRTFECLITEPAPVKTFEFLEGHAGAIEGRLVVFVPYDGVAKRILLLWKHGKHRCIRMDNVGNVKPEMLNDLYRRSVLEARAIALKVYQKRKANKHEKEQAPPLVNATRSAAVQQNDESMIREFAPVDEYHECSMPQEVEVPPQAEVKQQPQQKEEPPIMKGFLALYEGKMVSAKVEPHVKTGKNGTSEEYTTYTLTLRNKDGLVQATGNDLKRALSSARAAEGHILKVVHLRDQPLPSGFNKKIYQVFNLSNGSSLVK